LIDEDGYLMDEDENYLFDDNGRRVQLTQEEMLELQETIHEEN
jgi:hypothetical protein